MRTLQVYEPDSITGVLVMRFPKNRPSSVTGVQTLLQNIVLYLRTKPGSDAFSTDRGSILGDSRALSKVLNNQTQLKVLISDSIQRCQSYLIDQQTKQRERGQILAPDETLNKLEINNIYQGADITSIFVEILVYTDGNKQYFLTV